MFSIKKNLLVAAAAGAMFALCATASNAALILTVNGTPIADGSAGDQSPAAGAVSASLVVSGFNVTLSAATSNSPGSATGATLSINSLTVVPTSAAVASSLTITASDTNYTTPGGAGSLMTLLSTLTGTFTNASIGNNASFISYADPSNAQPATAVPTSSIAVTQTTPNSPTSFNLSTSTLFTRNAGAFSLANGLTLSLSANGQANLTGTTVANAIVPEPTSLALLGLAGSTIVVRSRRRSVR